MRLPNPDKVIITKEKLTDYLLSQSHPIGKSKILSKDQLRRENIDKKDIR